MNSQKSKTWLAVLGIGCVVILCLVLIVVAVAVVLFFINAPATSAVVEEITAITVEVQPIADTPLPSNEPVVIQPTNTPVPIVEATQDQPTDSPPPTAEPTQPPPTASGPALTGAQSINEYSIFDDFSSDALNWPTYDDGLTVIQYEDEAYHFTIAEANYYDWAYFPVDFIPYEISFDVHGLPGEQDGTFGVLCQYQDEANYYYVEFDLGDNYYLIGQAVDGEYIALTTSDISADDWLYASELNAPASQVNHIGVGCYLESISLFINNQYVNEVSVAQPFDNPGSAAFFVYAYDFVDDDGYEVIFDNVDAYQPVQ